MEDRVHLPDGSWLGYRTTGNGHCQLVMLHGFAANMGTWHDLVPLFDENRYTLHLLDLPPHGTASRKKRSDYSIPAQAERVAYFLETRGLANVTMIGHSMGGSIVLALAIHQMEVGTNRVARMVLLDSPAYPQPLPQLIDLLSIPLLGPLFVHLLPARTIAIHGLQAVLSDHNLITPDRIERYASTFRIPGTAAAIARCAQQLLPPNASALTAAYQHLTQPTLLLWGDQDRIVKPTQGEQLVSDMPYATMDTIPLSGHNPHEENPAAVHRLIEQFFSNNPVDSKQGRC